VVEASGDAVLKWDFPPGYNLVPVEALEARAAKAGQLCRQKELAGLLLTFNTDVFYLSGTMQQGAVFVDDLGRLRIFMRRHQERAQAECPFEVTPVNGYSQIAEVLNEQLPKGAQVGLTLDVMPAREFQGWKGRLPDLELVDASQPWLELKGVKDGVEIDTLTRSGQLSADLYGELPNLLVPGKSESQAAGEFLTMAMARGAASLIRARSSYMDMYSWHLVSGPEATWPSAVDAPLSGVGLWPAFPMGASLKPLKRDEPIIVDVAICLEGYATDQTRTYYIGKAPEPVKLAHKCLEEVEATILERLRPGAISGEIFNAAIKVAEDMGMGDGFLGRPGHRIRFVGHGVGLELGAPPYLLAGSKAEVQAGQVYALELKIVLDQGPIGLENTVLVNEDGPPTVLSPIANQIFEL
jgi:Xaa-Pro dipeptidase